MSRIDTLLDEVSDLELQIKKKWPKQKGKVFIANIKTEMDYEFGKPENDIEQMKWVIEYKDRLKSNLA